LISRYIGQSVKFKIKGDKTYSGNQNYYFNENVKSIMQKLNTIKTKSYKKNSIQQSKHKQ